MISTRQWTPWVVGLAAAGIAGVLWAAGDTVRPWIEDEATLEPGAQIYLGTVFGLKKGRFNALPESILDTNTSIEGNFVVASYRFVYQKPVKDSAGKLFDELISTEMLDCKRQFYGTLKQVRLRKGRPVSESSTRDADVLMTQTQGVNLGSKLCDLYAQRAVQPLVREGVNNPAYQPQPSNKDIDALIDRHMPIKKNGAK